MRTIPCTVRAVSAGFQEYQDQGNNEPRVLREWRPHWRREVYCDRVGRSARIRNGTTVLLNPHWSCVAYTILYQRGLIDISRRADDLLWSTRPPLDQPPAVRHLMENPQADTTLCDHHLGPGDTVEYKPIDGESVECADCLSRIGRS